MATRKYIDWDSVEPLYRAGGLSLHNICDQYAADHSNSQVWKKTVTHAAILKRAKAKKWTRNLASKVQSRIKEKLVTGLVTSNKLSDDEIIEKSSEVGVNVVIRNRATIHKLGSLENHLLDKLSAVYVENDEIINKIDISKLSHQEKIELLTRQPLLLKTCSQILKNLSEVVTKRITLERQAHNIDGSEATEKIEDILRDL